MICCSEAERATRFYYGADAMILVARLRITVNSHPYAYRFRLSYSFD
jgi:hypothetical protein